MRNLTPRHDGRQDAANRLAQDGQPVRELWSLKLLAAG